MLSVAVHKDIAEYQPKIVGKMTMRTLVSIMGALSVSVLAGLYIYFVLGLNVSDCTYFIYAVSLPFSCYIQVFLFFHKNTLPYSPLLDENQVQ